MILQKLTEFYDRLQKANDPITGQVKVPSYGFSDENVSYCLVLSKAGKLVDVQDIRDTSEKKPRPKRIGVPQPEKRTSGVKPNFLWDKTSYVLGIEGNKDKLTSKTTPWVLSTKTNVAFQQFHAKALADQDDEGLVALRMFLSGWSPTHFPTPLLKPEHVDANVVFKLDGEETYVHESSAAKRLWLSLFNPIENEAVALPKSACLVTGVQAQPSRLHPAIKGVYGGQSSGGSIVSFNAESYESFGKKQGENAPVSDKAAFAYTTVLNYMLRRENGHCLSIGDTSTVFFAEAKTVEEEKDAVSVFSALMNHPSDDGQRKKLENAMEAFAKGRPFAEVLPSLDPQTRFYVLGLAPNASRISIRYWLDGTLGALGERLSEHWRDLQIEPLPWKAEKPPSFQRFLLETVPLRKKDGQYDYMGRKFDDIPPHLSGEFLRSILTGQRYPRSILTQLVQRLRTDGDVNGFRVALIKAMLQRECRKGFLKEEVPMSLDIENAPQAYRLGCLFAILDHAQNEAVQNANSTLSERYYGAASSVPFSVFPNLIAKFQTHLSKIKKERPGFAVNLSKLFGTLMGTLQHNFPKQFSLEQQGQFAVGYYHQRQSFFVKKEPTDFQPNDFNNLEGKLP